MEPLVRDFQKLIYEKFALFVSFYVLPAEMELCRFWTNLFNHFIQCDVFCLNKMAFHTFKNTSRSIKTCSVAFCLVFGL